MNVDKHISDDLVIVARASRAHPIALEATLARVAAPPAPPLVPAWQTVYMLRLARTYAGATALAFVLLVFAAGAVRSPALVTPLDGFFDISKPWVVVLFAGLALAAYGIGLRVALGRGTPARVDRLWRWSVAVPVAGGVASLVFFGVWFMTSGYSLVTLFAWDGTPIALHDFSAGNRLLIVLGGVAGLIGAFAVARAPRAIRSSGRIGLLLVLAAWVVGEWRGAGVATDAHAFGDVPFSSFALRAGLTAAATAGWFLIASRFALRARAREDAMLAQYAS